MKSEELYLTKKLNLQVLATQVGVSVKRLRVTILINTGKTFNEFINDYRVDRAQKLISRGFLDRNTTIALAEKCGFNSHQTFFRAFRKKTNVTPKTYLENLNNKKKMKNIIYCLLLLIIISCGKESPEVADQVISFTLTVNSSSGGSVSSTGGS